MKSPQGVTWYSRPSAVALVALGLALSLIAGALFATPSQAAFPGQPGRIVYVHSPGMMQADIWTINPEGGGAVQLTTDPQPESAPAWSYDGQRIAFVRPAPEQEIFAMDANGGGQINLTNNDVLDSSPSFFPDGRIAFGSRPGGDEEIFVMSGDGSGQTNITNNGPIIDRAPAVSPDGTKIAFERFDGTDLEIYLMNADGSNAVPLTNNGISAETGFAIADQLPSWSPDGRRISWRRGDGVNTDIFVMNADGSGQAPIAASSNSETFAGFAPDNSRLLFTQSVAGQQDLYTLGLIPPGPPVPVTATGRDSQSDWQPIPVNCAGRRATIVGTPAADALTGTPGADVISGQGGKDKILGLQGNDRLCGNKGKDKLKGGKGKDRLKGGKGKDRLIGGGGSDKCTGGKGNDSGKGCETGKL